MKTKPSMPLHEASAEQAVCAIYDLMLATNSMSANYGRSDARWSGDVYNRLEGALRSACEDLYGAATADEIIRFTAALAGEDFDVIVASAFAEMNERRHQTARRKVFVNTRLYRQSHVREPRGRGGWLFAFGDETAEPRNFNGTYTEARRAAVVAAREFGTDIIYVLP